MPYSTCIFDLDGTLSDPLDGMAAALNFALSEHGYATVDPSELAQYVGPPLEGSLAALTGRDDEEHTMSLVRSYREHYLDSGFARNTVYPGINELLSTLRQSGQRLGVCTSKPATTARKILSLFQLESYFSFVSGGDVGIVKGQQLEQLLNTGEIDAQALMIGDRDVDVLAATGNGLASAAVLWGYGSRDELQGVSPNHLLEHPLQLLDLLRQVA